MRRIFAIWAVCLCWGILNAAPLGPFNATLLEQLKNDYQKGEKEVTRYIELQEKVAEKYIKMTPLSVTAKKKLPPSKDPRDYMTLSPYWWPDSTKIDGLPYKDIADMLNISVKTINNHIAFALDEIAKRLNMKSRKS